MTHPPIRPSMLRKENPTWRDRLTALRYVPPLLRMVWETHRGYTIGTAILRLLRAFVPVATLWVGKLIIDTVVASREGSPDFQRIWRLVALEIAIVLVGEVLARASSLIESLLGDLFSNRTSVRLMEHAATLDLYHFEDPAFYDQLERARRQTVGRIGLLTELLEMSQDALTLISLGAALLTYSPWLVGLLVLAVIPSFLGETHFASLGYSLLYRWTPERRQLDYLRYVGASDKTAKEVQMFALAPWLTERYRTLSERFYEENKRLSIKKGIVSTILSVFGTAGYYSAYAIILVRAVTGAITIGSLTFLAASFARSRDLIQRLLLGASDIYEQALYLKDMFDFFEMRPSIVSPPAPDALQVPRPIRKGFVFEDVGFRYAGSELWAVRHVNFTLGAGERVAFVGENGAGKTTLTKLMARLYDVTEGRILLDGTDLREYDLASVRRSIGVIFQDFVRYDMRFDENIGVGEIEEVRNYLDTAGGGTWARERMWGGETFDPSPGTLAAAREEAAGNGGKGGRVESVSVPATLAAAAEKSLAASLLPRFAAGYQQMLGRRFDGGVDLSGGEWQKIALARAYMRDAQVLILDEPTASLDARAEYEVFLRFSELVAGRMAVLISHRFSTVRMADRIIVLQGGQIVEHGTHDHLVRHGGLYAELFRLQAAGYK
ncbi:MAG: ABC transporter ATP-binding protein [Gemmatimonadaceae bacterium]